MGTKKMTLCHKRNDCIGCGSCAMIAPGRFTMNAADGKADMKDSEWHGDEFMVAKIDEDEYELNKQAADVCPVGIIRLD